MLQEELINRFAFHPAGVEKAEVHETVRSIVFTAAKQLNLLLPEGRELALAITKLEEAMFWANAGVARKEDG